MQTIKVYPEKNHIRAQVVGFDNIAEYSEVFMYSNPIVIYTGVNNPIKITCLNSDQKKIDVSNVSIQFGLFEPNTENELVSIIASPIDTANGVVQATLTSSDLAPFDVGDYEIALSALDNTGNVYPVYINDFFGSRLKTSLRKGPTMGMQDPMPLTFLDTPGIGVVSNQINLMTRPINSTVATMSCNLISYTGNVVAQGTLISIPTNLDWGNVSAIYYSNTSGYVMQSVIGSFAWTRFLLDSADPTGNGNVIVSTFVTNGNIRI